MQSKTFYWAIYQADSEIVVFWLSVFFCTQYLRHSEFWHLVFWYWVSLAHGLLELSGNIYKMKLFYKISCDINDLMGTWFLGSKLMFRRV